MAKWFNDKPWHVRCCGKFMPLRAYRQGQGPACVATRWGRPRLRQRPRQHHVAETIMARSCGRGQWRMCTGLTIGGAPRLGAPPDLYEGRNAAYDEHVHVMHLMCLFMTSIWSKHDRSRACVDWPRADSAATERSKTVGESNQEINLWLVTSKTNWSKIEQLGTTNLVGRAADSVLRICLFMDWQIYFPFTILRKRHVEVADRSRLPSQSSRAHKNLVP
jgi:hypothetical protein